MELTRQRKVFIGILALAGVAFAMDQLVFSGSALGPQSAHADVLQPAATPTAAKSEGAAPRVQREPLAERIEALAPAINSQAAAEAFNSTPEWLNGKSQAQGGERQGANDKSFEVTTIFSSDRITFVNVGGKIVKLGDAHLGWTLKSVDAKAGIAVFSDGTREREIRRTESRR